MRRDFQTEQRGTPPPRPLNRGLPTAVADTVAAQVKRGAFKLYESAREEGLLE